MLVPGLGQEVGAVDVTPEKLGRDGRDGHQLLRSWADDLLAVLEVSAEGAAAVWLVVGK